MPLACIRVVMGSHADLLGPRERIIRWFWSGILGELYGSAIETRFDRDMEQVPAWALDTSGDVAAPRTVQDANFVESRLHYPSHPQRGRLQGALRAPARQRGARLDEGQGARQGAVRKPQVDIHHIFPKARHRPGTCRRSRRGRRSVRLSSMDCSKDT
ncbi:MAG: hypothetical protein MSC31_18620 [Solirubrobacteraceae bacterium MAG38_C4-C5]|nr:hypothetical protein [Candidatus Siliceabacter maunaloa]